MLEFFVCFPSSSDSVLFLMLVSTNNTLKIIPLGERRYSDSSSSYRIVCFGMQTDWMKISAFRLSGTATKTSSGHTVKHSEQKTTILHGLFIKWKKKGQNQSWERLPMLTHRAAGWPSNQEDYADVSKAMEEEKNNIYWIWWHLIGLRLIIS